MKRVRGDAVLLLVALIWGSAFAVQRVAARYFDAFTFNGLRFLLGGLILLPFGKLNPLIWLKRDQSSSLYHPRNRVLSVGSDNKAMFFILLAGGILFAAAGLQQLGLESTTASNAGFINTLYVVFVPIILVIFWKEAIPWTSWLGAGIAILGSLLLSTGGRLHLAIGDALELVGALFWALHVIVVGLAVRHTDVLTFSSGQYLTVGALNLLVSLAMQSPWGGIRDGWWTIAYIAFLSTAIGYTLQAYGQTHSPPTDVTILLSMEAVFAVLVGYTFLDERMELIQLVGCGMIIAAVIITQARLFLPKADVI